MAETSMTPAAAPKKKSSLSVLDARTRKRNAAETRFRMYGMSAIAVGLLFLVFLFASILRSGLPAFTHTVMQIEFILTQEQFDTAESKMLKTGEYQKIFVKALTEQLDASGLDVGFDNKAIKRIVGKPGGTIRSFFLENPDRIGTPVSFELAASSRVDGYFNGRVTRDTLVDSRFLMATDLDLVDALKEAGIVKGAFNWNFITGTDSGVDNPGGAGWVHR